MPIEIHLSMFQGAQVRNASRHSHSIQMKGIVSLHLQSMGSTNPSGIEPLREIKGAKIIYDIGLIWH